MRRILNWCGLAVVFSATATIGQAEPDPATRLNLLHQTHTYKTEGHLQIQAEVTRVRDDRLRPVLIWIHGGALMKGDRFGQWERPFPSLMLQAGYIIVSIDYRLAPETKLPGIIEDVVDACEWVRAKGPELFDADVDRLAVAGGSAGGYLTLAAGNHVMPRLTVLASFSGYCDLTGPWATGPSTDPSHLETTLSQDAVAAFEPGPPVSNKYERTDDITPTYNAWRQTGFWPEATTGWDPKTETEKYLPYLNDRGVNPEYPPTIQIHGTHDLDVDFHQAVQMSESLEEHGVHQQLILIEGGSHNLDGVPPGQTEDALRKAMAFVRYHMEE